MFLPFSKIDKERRMVWGVAQAEVPDHQGDYLDYAASERAFKAWSGRNLREMHENVAIGQALDIQYDPVNKQIVVGAYISKGAPDAWAKLIDGTYKGFSIGGVPIKASTFVKNGRALRRITEYSLDELSLVDIPANPKCVITAIQKRGSTLVATDILDPFPILTARDVLVPHFQKGTRMKKRAKIGSLVGFSKTLEPQDEVVVVRMSDFTKSADGRFILKPDATIANFKKADLDQDGYTDQADDTTDDEPANGVDSKEGAQKALDLHDDMHKLGGHTECNCDRDDDALPIKDAGEKDDDADDDADAVGGDDMGKSRTHRRRKDALRKNRRPATRGLSKADITGMFSEFAKSFDAKFDKLGTSGDPAPRKTTDSTLVKRDDVAAGNPIDPRAGDLETRLTAAKAKRSEFLKKGIKNITADERMERENLAQEIISLEENTYALTGGRPR